MSTVVQMTAILCATIVALALISVWKGGGNDEGD